MVQLWGRLEVSASGEQRLNGGVELHHGNTALTHAATSRAQRKPVCVAAESGSVPLRASVR
jgi:hypothetical protein